MTDKVIDKNIDKNIEKITEKTVEKNTNNQEEFLNYKPIDFKDTNVSTYTLKINSKERNIFKEPNPFNFEIIFNQVQTEQRAIIQSKFENIKKIGVSQLIVPRYIPRDYIGEPFTGITPLFHSGNSISLSYYPGININNTVVTGTDVDGNQFKMEVIELVDLCLKKMYLVPIQFNNPFYTTKHISIKSELYSYLNINNEIYPIVNIIGNVITLESNIFELPNFTNQRLIVADFYKNCLIIDTNGTVISINENTINIKNSNILNFQYLFNEQFIEYQINSINNNNIYERKIFKIKFINYESNNTISIDGIWTCGLPSTYDNSESFYDTNHLIKLNQFNFGVRDLFEEKMFYLNLYPFVPSKNVSTDPNVNDSFGILYPSTPNSTKDYLYLRGDAIESYTNVNLQNTNNKIQFSLMDSNNKLIGNIYKKYINLYKPTELIINSYLPFKPDLMLILKIEEVDKKFTNIG